MKKAEVKKITLKEVGEKLGVSYRQQVLNLSRRVYEGLNNMHFTEMLAERKEVVALQSRSLES